MIVFETLTWLANMILKHTTSRPSEHSAMNASQDTVDPSTCQSGWLMFVRKRKDRGTKEIGVRFGEGLHTHELKKLGITIR